MIIIKAERKAVKEWLKTGDREELDEMLQAAIFTPDEQKYIHMRLIEGMTFKEIAIDQSLTRKSVARIARRIAKKMYKSQVMQSAALFNQLRPFPHPAYITASPYQTLAGYGL